MKILNVLLRIETLKTVKRRAFWVAVGVFAAINTSIAVDNVRTARRFPSFPHALPESWPSVLSGLTSPAGFFIAVLIILLVAPEFSWRTGRQNVIDGLSKERLYAGKVMLLAGLIVLFVATTLLIGVGGILFSPSEGGPGIIRPTDLSYLSGLTLNLLFFGSAGLMLATLIRSAGPAMGVLFLYFLVEEAIVRLIERAGETATRITEYSPLNISEDLGDDLAHYPEVLASVNADRAERGLSPLEFLDVEVLVTAVLAYSTTFLLISFLSMRRRDL